MGIVVSYDDKFGTPYSEIELASGERVLMTLDHNGLVIKALARPGNAECVLFKDSPNTVAKICAGLVDYRNRSNATPLQILVSAVKQLPNVEVVAATFKTAAAP